MESDGSQLSYESSLLLLAQQGNLRAQGQLVENNQLEVRRFVAGLSGDLNQSDDLAQEVFLRVLKRITAVESAEKLPAYLRGVARNVVKEHFKKQKTRQSHQQRWTEIYEQLHQVRLAEVEPGDAKLEKLSICMEKLPEKSQQLLELQYLQGMNASEMGESLKQKATAVRKSLSRIRVKLLDCLNRPSSTIATQK